MVGRIDADGYPLGKEASGFCLPNASCVSLEQEDAKIFLQCLGQR